MKKVYLSTMIGLSAFGLAGSRVQAATCGQLAAVKGKGVEILRMQSAREGEKIRYGMRIEEGRVTPLECDDVVLAGKDSSAKIILANGKLSLAPESRIEIAAHALSSTGSEQVRLINLTYGKVRALIMKTRAAKPEPSGPQAAPTGKGEPAEVGFRVRTFSAVVGVRGTDFFTSYDPNSGLTEQATLDGLVEVQQAGTTNKVLVKGGQQVTVETTPAAVRVAQREGSTQGPTGEIDPGAGLAPLKVEPIRESTRNDIRLSSVAARDDVDFSHPKAIRLLGKPDSWTIEREKPPEKMKDLKNEF